MIISLAKKLRLPDDLRLDAPVLKVFTCLLDGMDPVFANEDFIPVIAIDKIVRRTLKITWSLHVLFIDCLTQFFSLPYIIRTVFTFADIVCKVPNIPHGH